MIRSYRRILDATTTLPSLLSSPYQNQSFCTLPTYLSRVFWNDDDDDSGAPSLTEILVAIEIIELQLPGEMLLPKIRSRPRGALVRLQGKTPQITAAARFRFEHRKHSSWTFQHGPWAKTLEDSKWKSPTKRWHGGPSVDKDTAACVKVTFIDSDEKPIQENVDAFVGESLLQVAQRNGIELEGACEGVCACSTCHVIFPDWKTFDRLEEASEDEEDMLDMAYGLTETSRLSCQILIADHMDGMQVEIPKATRNFYVDGHVPQPH